MHTVVSSYAFISVSTLNQLIVHGRNQSFTVSKCERIPSEKLSVVSEEKQWGWAAVSSGLLSFYHPTVAIAR